MGKKKRSSRSGRGNRQSGAVQSIFRMLDRILSQSDQDASGEVHQAGTERLIDMMMTAENIEDQVVLAEMVLQADPDCVDAYCILADTAPSMSQAIDLFRRGVEAGERGLQEEGLHEEVGHYWLITETRPYMRARLGLAECLWSIGERDEAIEHYQALLQLNPNDNQGVRYLLATALAELDRDDELERLLDQYSKDASVVWEYTRALLMFRTEGDSEAARQSLLQAYENNPYMADYVVGNKMIPRELPAMYSPGDESEAIVYAAGQMACWKATQGAVSWMRRLLKLSVRQQGSRGRRNWDAWWDELENLPQHDDEVWQVDVLRFPKKLDFAGRRMKPWITVVFNASDNAPLVAEFSEDRPSNQEVWGWLLESMCQLEEENHEHAHRPGSVEVRLKTLHKKWQNELGQLDIQCVQKPKLDELSTMLDAIAEKMQTRARQEEIEIDESSLEELPQSIGEVWQVDYRRLPTWAEYEGELTRPWCILVASRTNDDVLGQHIQWETPEADHVWTVIALAMAQPEVEEAHRPGVIELRAEEIRDELAPRLEAIGVQSVLSDELDELDEMFRGLFRYLTTNNGESIASLVDIPGITTEQLAGYFEAAAQFYRAAPWKSVGWEVPIRIECSKFESGPWHTVIMGQSGMTMGFALYEDLDFLQSLLRGELSDDAAAHRTSAISVTYGEEFDIQVRDLEAIESHNWPIAAPEAYPCAIRLNPGQAMRPPLVWELELIEGCLRALPEFIRRKEPTLELSVPTASGSLDFRMSNVES